MWVSHVLQVLLLYVVMLLFVSFDVLFAVSSYFNSLQNKHFININMGQYLLCQMSRITNNIRLIL